MNDWPVIAPYFAQAPIWQWIGLGIALCLLIGLWYKVYRRPNRQGLWLRLIGTSVALLALLALFLMPQYVVEVPPKSGILATDNAPIDSLLDAYPNWPVFQMSKEFNESFDIQKPLVFLPNLLGFKMNNPSVKRLYLYGDGIEKTEKQYLDSMEVVAHLNPLPDGLLNLQWPSSIQQNTPFVIAGSYQQIQKESLQLELIGPMGNVVLLNSDSSGLWNFEQELSLQQVGSYLFSVLENEKDTIGHFGVQVLPSQSIKVLIVNHAPSFEMKYLKNWLSEQGFAVAVRSTISRDRFKTEFYNQPSFPFQQLSKKTLAQHDLLILPASALILLNKQEQRDLKLALEDGLGLAILLDRKLEDIPLSIRRWCFDFSVRSASSEFDLTIGKEVIALERAPYRVMEQENVNTLGISNTGAIYSAAKPAFKGIQGVLLAQNTYLLQLNGKQAVYHALWKKIVESIARRSTSEVVWQFLEEPILKNHPLEVQFLSSSNPSKVELYSSNLPTVVVAPAQYPFHEERWSVEFQALDEGWHKLVLPEAMNSGRQFYVSGENEWKTLRRARKIKANHRWIQERKHQLNKVEGEMVKEYRPYPAWWFYLLFLVSMITLWIEEKW